MSSKSMFLVSVFLRTLPFNCKIRVWSMYLVSTAFLNILKIKIIYSHPTCWYDLNKRRWEHVFGFCLIKSKQFIVSSRIIFLVYEVPLGIYNFVICKDLNTLSVNRKTFWTKLGSECPHANNFVLLEFLCLAKKSLILLFY